MRDSTAFGTATLGMAVFFGHGIAAALDDTLARGEVGTVRFIDRAANIIQLDHGTELHTTDPRLLASLKEGMQVLVDFVHTDGDRNELRGTILRNAGGSPGMSRDTTPHDAMGRARCSSRRRSHSAIGASRDGGGPTSGRPCAVAELSNQRPWRCVLVGVSELTIR